MRAECSRCGRRRSDVMYTAFNEGGPFRSLCGVCEELEKDVNWPVLIELPRNSPNSSEIEPCGESLLDPCAQYSLF